MKILKVFVLAAICIKLIPYIMDKIAEYLD